MIPGKETDIKPSHGTSEEEEEEGGEEDPESFTTLRKSSAFTLERISKIIHDDVFFILQPFMENLLLSPEWELQEMAILALGAISDPDGAINGIKPHLQNLVPFLIQMFKNNNEVVRATSLWTLSKFADWFNSDGAPFFQNYVTEIIGRIKDCD